MRTVVAIAVGAALLVALAVCGGDSEPPPVAVAAPSPTPIPTPVPAATPEPTSTPTPTATPEPTPTFEPAPVILPTVIAPLEKPTLADDVPLDLDRRLDAIGLTAAAIRNLSARNPVERRVVSADEIRAALREDFEEDAADLDLSDRLYTRLGIIGPEVDLSGLLLDTFTSIALGMFNTDENVLYVVGSEDAFSLQNELTAAHEYVHALQHLHFDIGGMIDAVEDNSDRGGALRALIEGDAELAQLIYFNEAFEEHEQQAIREESADNDMSAFLAAPRFIQRGIAFPYGEGMQFVIGLYLQANDFGPVDAAYGAPPSSTEQVIHPDRYGVDEPVEVSFPDPLADGWAEADRDVMGELFIRSLLEGGMSFERAGEAADGWGGDSYLLLESPDGGDAVASVSVWDTEDDAAEFAAAASAYFGALTGGEWSEADGGAAMRLSTDEADVHISVDGLTVHLAIADSAEQVETVAKWLGNSER